MWILRVMSISSRFLGIKGLTLGKIIIMSAVEIRTELHQLIDEIDEHFLKAVHSMVSTYHTEKPLGYEVNGNPIWASKLGVELDEEVGKARQGNYITVEELEKRSEKRLTRTK